MKNKTNGGGQDSSPLAIVRYGAVALTTALMIGCGGSSGGDDSSSSSSSGGGGGDTAVTVVHDGRTYTEVTSPSTGKIC